MIGLAIALVLLAPPPKPLFRPWMDATTAEPRVQVQRIDADTFVIRQSIATNFEGPFLYLLFGRDRALLLDSGAGGLTIRPTIDALIAGWAAAHHRAGIPLVVAHSHGHGDHHQGDAEFAGRPDTQVVGLSPAAVAKFFGIVAWPDTIAPYDLGGRTLDIIPTPGHQDAHIMVHDRRTRLLLSGDMLYPGRLYVPENHFAEFRASADRLVDFAHTHPIHRLLGAHIEMTATPAQDYAREAPNHPGEHRLEMLPSAIFDLQKAVAAMGDTPVRRLLPDFIITPVPPRP
ncbi:MBL fold metallo-hydrolase [Sandarakinorhabdus sp. DWP1-3-1]|uniref:MBL fold metallo-hydrolase n=1 Tax=Sandarakinorhabdus sp. DWP1-3-1 TaxID=2804627 RepID=UPI003CF1887A